MSLLALVRHLLLARFSSLLLVLFSLPGFLSPHFLSSPLSSRFNLYRFSPHRTYLSFVLYLRAVFVGAVRPKLTPSHLRTVTMTTRALSKKAGVGARERMLLSKNEGGLQSS